MHSVLFSIVFYLVSTCLSKSHLIFQHLFGLFKNLVELCDVFRLLNIFEHLDCVEIFCHTEYNGANTKKNCNTRRK